MDLLRGIGISGYRSFGHETVQYLAPLSKVNLIAGQNNAGKSNLLRSVEEILLWRGSRKKTHPNPLDSPVGVLASDRRRRFALPIDSELVRQTFGERYKGGAEILLSKLVVPDTGDIAWIQYSIDSDLGLRLDTEWLKELHGQLDEKAQQAAADASSRLTQTSGGGPTDNLARVFDRLNVASKLPLVKTIPAFRQIQHSEEDTDAFDGIGLIKRLASLESPNAVDYAEREKFDSIQEFVRTVLDDHRLTITVPRANDTINIRLSGGAVLPLEHMGTGIHQVVILAAAATLMSNTVVCMEEPEIHLHPLLQRKLLRYLANKTSNQYLIATHSAHMLDSEIASIFHLTHTSASGSRVRPAITPEDRAGICADLGYRSSDLVQANAVIWVEGPSDRIYLRKWIELANPSFIEGIHYSIMFYGGRLLNHLTANDPDINEFISLRRLNRNVAILIDSDKTGSRARINPTKARVRDELKSSGVAWITRGYTVENYVPENLLRDAVESSHRSGSVGAFGQWQNPLGSPVLTGIKSADKVAIARYVVANWADDSEWPFDLRARVREVCAFISAANEESAPVTT